MTGPNAMKTAKQIACAYCGEPTRSSQRITADHKLYCGKLCAALGLIRNTDDEDGIDGDTGVDALQQLVADCLLDGPRIIPTKVRDCDVDAALDSLSSDRFVIVVIEDEGTPDWIPEEPLAIAKEAAAKNEAHGEPSQAEIDQVVEDLLSNGSETEDRP